MRTRRYVHLLALISAFAVSGCAGSPGGPPSPTSSTAVATRAIATPGVDSPSTSPTPQPTSDCGATTLEAISSDVLAGPLTLPFTRNDVAASWNERASDKTHDYRINDWTPLPSSGSLAGFVAAIADAGMENQFVAIEMPGGQAVGVGLVIYPSTPMAEPVVSGRFLHTLVSLFQGDTAVLRDVGVSLPLSGYETLAGINECTYFSWGADFWLRAVQATNADGQVFVYIRTPTEAERTTAIANAKSRPKPAFAYPPASEHSWAPFAPPLPSIPDAMGNPDGWITPIPSLVIKLLDPASQSVFLGTVTPAPGGGTIYRRPAKDGTPAFTMVNPFSPSELASGVDVLTFLGGNLTEQLPAPAKLFEMIPMIAQTPTGEVMFYLDGERLACSWTGGAMEAPSRGHSRGSVQPICRGT